MHRKQKSLSRSTAPCCINLAHSLTCACVHDLHSTTIIQPPSHSRNFLVPYLFCKQYRRLVRFLCCCTNYTYTSQASIDWVWLVSFSLSFDVVLYLAPKFSLSLSLSLPLRCIISSANEQYTDDCAFQSIRFTWRKVELRSPYAPPPDSQSSLSFFQHSSD